jgi:hypothetical protein
MLDCSEGKKTRCQSLNNGKLVALATAALVSGIDNRAIDFLSLFYPWLFLNFILGGNKQ